MLDRAVVDNFRAGTKVRWWVYPAVIVGTLLVLLNFAMLANVLPQIPEWGGRAGDWYYWGQVDLADPYAWEWVRWSPPAVWLNTTIQPWAYPVVFALNIVALTFLPWRVALIAVLLWPFWGSQLHGSLLPMIVVAAWTALDGRKAGVVAFVLFAALIPRPLMLPVLVVLLYRYPLARWAFGASVLFVVGYSLAVGQLDDWVLRLTAVGADQPYNVSPSAWIGAWWYPVGLTLAAFLTWRGWYGLASLAISPYLFTSYLLFALLDLRRLHVDQPHVGIGRRRLEPGVVEQHLPADQNRVRPHAILED
jgi:hypothetical protein